MGDSGGLAEGAVSHPAAACDNFAHGNPGTRAGGEERVREEKGGRFRERARDFVS